jgi:hypothetical protein
MTKRFSGIQSDAVIQFHLPQAMFSHITATAKEMNTSRADLIRRACIKFLSEYTINKQKYPDDITMDQLEAR